MTPGERQEEDNRKHKDTTGSSPNGVANKFLSDHRGMLMTVELPVREVTGVLVRFDAYSMVLNQAGTEILVFKGPGVVARPASG